MSALDRMRITISISSDFNDKEIQWVTRAFININVSLKTRDDLIGNFDMSTTKAKGNEESRKL